MTYIVVPSLAALCPLSQGVEALTHSDVHLSYSALTYTALRLRVLRHSLCSRTHCALALTVPSHSLCSHTHSALTITTISRSEVLPNSDCCRNSAALPCALSARAALCPEIYAVHALYSRYSLYSLCSFECSVLCTLSMKLSPPQSMPVLYPLCIILCTLCLVL
jgi:hypothetical protein